MSHSILARTVSSSLKQQLKLGLVPVNLGEHRAESVIDSTQLIPGVKIVVESHLMDIETVECSVQHEKDYSAVNAGDNER